MINDTNNNLRRGVVNGQAGTWVPVETAKVSENISTDPNKPSLGADNGYYYADPYVAAPTQNSPYVNVPNNYSPFGSPQPIAANMNNAIPTPSSIVQLPPIVQPIAMVPFASQNQPLVQYDPNVRPEVAETKTPEPVYRRRPFVGLSVLVLVLAFITIIMGCIIPPGKAAILNVINLVQQGEVAALIGGDTSLIVPVVVGVLYALSFLFLIIVFIDAIVKVCRQKVVAKFNVCNLLALLCVVAAGALSFVLMYNFDVTTIISAIVMALVILIMMIVVGFANREEVIVDYVASKQTFIMK